MAAAAAVVPAGRMFSFSTVQPQVSGLAERTGGGPGAVRSAPRLGPRPHRAAVWGSFRVRVEAASLGGALGRSVALRPLSGGAEVPAAGLWRASVGGEQASCEETAGPGGLQWPGMLTQGKSIKGGGRGSYSKSL